MKIDNSQTKPGLNRLKTAVFLLAVVGTSISVFAQEGDRAINVALDKRPIVHQDATKFGAYDPHGDFSAQKMFRQNIFFFHGKMLN